jgi:hypothetical protein
MHVGLAMSALPGKAEFMSSRAARQRPVPVWLRLFLLLALAEAFKVAVGLFNPLLVTATVPWPASPLNARFIASLYGSLGVGILACLLSTTYRQVRIFVVGILVATSLLLAITLVRLVLHPGEVSRFPTLWVLVYIVDPLLMAFTLWRLGWRQEGGGNQNPVAPLWLAQVVVFGLLGVTLLLAPALAVAAWPWAMTEPQAQLYSAFFLTLAVTSLLASREPTWEAVRWLSLSIFLLAALTLLSSFLHLPRFRPGLVTPLWFLLFFVELFAFGGLLAVETLPRPQKQVGPWAGR